MHTTFVFFTITCIPNFLVRLSISCCNPFWLLATNALSSAYLMVSIIRPPTEIPASILSVACNIHNIRFNGHLPGEPGLAGAYWSKRWWRWWWQLDCWSYKSCKAPVKLSPPTNQHPVFFTGRMPFLSPNQQRRRTEGKSITFHGLADPKLTWGSSNFVFDH